MNFIGLLNPLGGEPCFGISIFESNDCYYTQVLTDADLIAEFIPCPRPDENMILITPSRVVTKGALGIYSFFFSTSEFIFGTRNEVAARLRHRFHEFSSRPFLTLDIADFLDDVKDKEVAFTKCSKEIFKTTLVPLTKELKAVSGYPTAVSRLAGDYAPPVKWALKQMAKRLTKEEKCLAERWKKENGETRITKEPLRRIQGETDQLRARLLKMLKEVPEVSCQCQEGMAEIVPLSDIQNALMDWAWEDGLERLVAELDKCQSSIRELENYNHSLLIIETLAGEIAKLSPDIDSIEHCLWMLLNSKSKPGAEAISKRVGRGITHFFSELVCLLEDFVNRNGDSFSSKQRQQILLMAEQTLARMPEKRKTKQFGVQDLAWRAVLLSKAGDDDSAGRLAAKAVPQAMGVRVKSIINVFMWWSRLGDAHHLVAKASRRLYDDSWVMCQYCYKKAMKSAFENRKIMLLRRQIEALADQVELCEKSCSEKAIQDVFKVANSGLEVSEQGRANTISGSEDLTGIVFEEARLRRSLVLAYKMERSDRASAAEREFLDTVKDVLQRNPGHLGAIRLPFEYFTKSGEIENAIYWIDSQVERLRGTRNESNYSKANYLEFRAAVYLSDLGETDEAQRRFYRMRTDTQRNREEPLRELLKIEMPSQETLAQLRYKEAYSQRIGSQERFELATKAITMNKPLIDQDPGKKDVVPWTRQARLLLMLGETDSARRVLEELRAMYPMDPYISFHLGETHYRQGVNDEEQGLKERSQEGYLRATEAFEEAMQMSPRVDTAHRLASCWARRNNGDEAKRMLLKGEKLDPTDGWTKFSLGSMAYQSGQLPDAIQYWFDALECFNRSEQQSEMREKRLARQAANAIVRFADDPSIIDIPVCDLEPLNLRMLASSAASAGWNRFKVVKIMGSHFASLPTIARRRVPHAARAHLLYLQLSEGVEAAYRWHNWWYERFVALNESRLLFEYACGAKGVFRRAALLSLSDLTSTYSHSLPTLPRGTLDEARWDKFLGVASTWGVTEDYYWDAYAAWPRESVSCEELWTVVCWLNKRLFDIAVSDERSCLTSTSLDSAKLLEAAKKLPLEIELLPAHQLEPKAPSSVLVQTDELYAQLLLRNSRDIVKLYATSQINEYWELSSDLLHTSILDSASLPPCELDTLKVLANRVDVEVTSTDGTDLTLGWPVTFHAASAL